MVGKTPGAKTVNYSNVDDEGLLRLIAHADKAALGHLYDRFGGLVFSIALKSVGQPETAEEITQDVFLRVWQNAGSYQVQRGKVSTWIASIARNRAIDMIRRHNIRPESQSVNWELVPPNNLPHADTLESKVVSSERRNQVRSAIASLPKDQQEALALAFFWGFSHQEVADFLDAPLGTVKTRIRLGMIKLRGLLEEIGPLE